MMVQHIWEIKFKMLNKSFLYSKGAIYFTGFHSQKPTLGDGRFLQVYSHETTEEREAEET